VRRRIATLGLSAALLAASTVVSRDASALIPVPVGGHPGEVDASFRLTLERGKVEPNENRASLQKARLTLYTVGVGYAHGDLGVLQDVTFRLEGTYFTSPAEVNDLSRGAVAPAQCITGRIPGPGQCEFHPANEAGFVSPSVNFNLVHQGDFSFGLFALVNIPVGIDFSKFVLPRTDTVAGGFTTGTRMTPWMSVEMRTYVGSGVSGKQNGTIAVTNLLGFEARRWLLPWKAGLKVGTYFDGDLFGESHDAAYDAAYTPGYPASSDRVRMMRFGVVVAPYFQITERGALELGYVQKVFGYDTPATQFYTAGVRVVF
jgi:hypothetical protein